MNSATSFSSSPSTELEPWLIVTQPSQNGEEPASHLAVWKIDGDNPQDALALFSDREKAERYALEFSEAVSARYRIEQFPSLQLLAVLAECYRRGMRCAALNPGRETAQQLFVLRDVLAAAKQRLRTSGELG